MNPYRQNRPERVCETLLRLAQTDMATPEAAARQLYRQFGQPLSVLLAELTPAQRQRLAAGLARRGNDGLLQWLRKEISYDEQTSTDCHERRGG